MTASVRMLYRDKSKASGCGSIRIGRRIFLLPRDSIVRVDGWALCGQEITVEGTVSTSVYPVQAQRRHLSRRLPNARALMFPGGWRLRRLGRIIITRCDVAAVEASARRDAAKEGR